MPPHKPVPGKFICKFCKRDFIHRTHMYRHMKHSCKIKKKIDDNVSKPKSVNPIQKKPTTINNDSAVSSAPIKVNDLVTIIKTQQDQIQQQKEQIDTLADLIKTKPSEPSSTPSTVSNSNNTTNNNNTVINNNIIYVTDKLDYLEILNEKFGEKKTIEFIKNKLHGKLQGEIDVFSEIHLSGPPNTWPIKCPDKSKRQFYLVQPDNTLVPDPGGVTTHKNFYRNLQTAVLKLINLELTKVIDKDVGSQEFESLRDGLLDDFDLQTFQNRALEMCHQKPGPFVKHLIDEIAQKEFEQRTY